MAYSFIVKQHSLSSFPEVIMKNAWDEAGVIHCVQKLYFITLLKTGSSLFKAVGFPYQHHIMTFCLFILSLWEGMTHSSFFGSNLMRSQSPWKLCLTTSTTFPPASKRWNSRRKTESPVRKRTSPGRWRTSSPGTAVVLVHMAKSMFDILNGYHA